MKHELEAHSLNSLAVRLKLLVSRGALRRWLDQGRLKPAQHFKQTESGSSRHLIFRKAFLDKLLEDLGEKYTARLKKLAKKNGDILRYHASAQANAARLFEMNKKRRAQGQKEASEPDPALDDDSARGVVHLTCDPLTEKNTFRICSGYGLDPKTKERKTKP